MVYAWAMPQYDNEAIIQPEAELAQSRIEPWEAEKYLEKRHNAKSKQLVHLRKRKAKAIKNAKVLVNSLLHLAGLIGIGLGIGYVLLP